VGLSLLWSVCPHQPVRLRRFDEAEGQSGCRVVQGLVWRFRRELGALGSRLRRVVRTTPGVCSVSEGGLGRQGQNSGLCGIRPKRWVVIAASLGNLDRPSDYRGDSRG